MVNLPMGLLPIPSKDLFVTDVNQNINQEYYEWLLKQHNYFPDYAFSKEKFEDNIKMEHSYTRDWKPAGNVEVISTRTILMERPPLCPSCHLLPPNHDEKVDIPEPYNIPIPKYNEEAGRLALNATEDMIKQYPNLNSDSDDWTENLPKITWSEQQLSLFERVERILDMDQLARLAISGLPNECLRRHAIVEKSASRMRKALAYVHWEPRLTQWLHSLFLTHLPLKYMVSYFEILQVLKRKIPTLVDKMLYGRQTDIPLDYDRAITKQPWEPTLPPKTRTLPSQSVIIVVPSTASATNSTSREKRWCDMLRHLATVVPIMVNLSNSSEDRKSIEQIAEQLIAVTRAKIQEIRIQTPNRHIILVGFNAGAAIALQVALVEAVNSIICMGFAFNTLRGSRGAPDDRILDLTIPVLFVLGQNAQKSSQEEIESLRERMSAQTSLVVVGSSDDALRVKRLNRTMEGVSQSMIDNMIVDEIYEFTSMCILNPPGPRKPTHLNGHRMGTANVVENGDAPPAKKQRSTSLSKTKTSLKSNVSRMRPTQTLGKTVASKKSLTHEERVLQAQLESIMSAEIYSDKDDSSSLKTALIDINEAAPTNAVLNARGTITQKVKFIPSNQFLHIKPPPPNTQKIYVKTQNGGNHSYTLGVNTIDGSEVLSTNKLVSVQTQNSSQIDNHSPNKHGKTITILKPLPNASAAEGDVARSTETTSLDNVNILDIPILFADSDGNVIDDNLFGSEASKPAGSSKESLQPIDIMSAEIVDDSIADQKCTVDTETSGMKTKIARETDSQSLAKTTKTLPRTTSNSGKFVVLNRDTLHQFKNVKHIPQIKYKKITVPSTSRSFIVPQTNVVSSTSTITRLTNGKTLIPGTKVNISKLVRPIGKPMKTGKYPNTITISSQPTNQPLLLNGRRQSVHAKSRNIVIRRGNFNNLPTAALKSKTTALNRNITVRKINIVQSLKKTNPSTNVPKIEVTKKQPMDGVTVVADTTGFDTEMNSKSSVEELIAELES